MKVYFKNYKLFFSPPNMSYCIYALKANEVAPRTDWHKIALLILNKISIQEKWNDGILEYCFILSL
jgi:hypothetical protein